MTSVENFNKVENVKENTPEWVKQQISVELNDLKNKVQLDNLKTDMFYEIKEENWEKKVDYHMDTVKAYLGTLKGLSMQAIRDKWAAWVMAVQIALESEGYNVWKIDWMLWMETKAAVRDFQTNQWIKVDWTPGPETIWKLLDVLWVDWSKTQSTSPEWDNEWDKDKWADEGVDRTEKFKLEKYRFLKRKLESLLPDNVKIAWSENPEFGIRIYYKDYPNVTKFIKFNFHDYLDWDILNENKLSSDIQKVKEERYEERTFQDRIVGNKYSLEDLFPWQWNNVALGQFFSKFRWNKLTIDAINTHFDTYWDKLYLQFDKRGFNATKWCDQQIDKSELKWEDWKYSQEKFKNKLKDIVTKVVDENF